MALEIRELVIQAQVAEEKKEHTEDENLPKVNSEQVEELITDEVQSSVDNLRDEMMREMKVWVKNYLNKQQRKY